jgi:P27 family predicted phage terminase small subunit
MPGPKPQPTTLKLLRGNPGKRPLKGAEPRPGGIPRCPQWLDDRAKAEWKRLGPQLIRLGLLTLVDRAAFSAYCQAWAEFDHATRTLKREGQQITTDGGYHAPHPAVAQQRSAWQAIKAFAAEFGLSPASRAGLGAGIPPQGDELDQFLRDDGTRTRRR